MATTHQIGALYNSLTAGSKIIGTVVADSDFRVDGIIEGDVKCKGKIVIGEKGAIHGDSECQNADIMGFVEGKMKADGTLSLRATGSINGDVHTKVLIVEPKAIFNGSCSMKQESPTPPTKGKDEETKKEETKKFEPKTIAEKKREEEVKAETKKEEPKKEETKKAEPKKEVQKPTQPQGEDPVLAVNESSIGSGLNDSIITFIDDEPEIVTVEA